MDFFSAVRDGDQPTAPTTLPDVQVFANAVEQRYGSHNVIRARLTPVKEIIPPASIATMSPAPSPQDNFLSVPPSDLAPYISDDNTLIVDIRPHAAYSDARLPRALSLSVPSTLLKRPLFSLEKLAAMLPSPSHRNRFSAFRSSPRILVYDADAQGIPPSSNICGLLRKFKAASYSGELVWLRGGFQAVWREQRHLVDIGPPSDDNDEDEYHGQSQINPSPPVVLRPKNLPMSAFALSSTTVANNRGSINTTHSSLNTRRPFVTHHHSIPMKASLSLPPPNSLSCRPAANPFFDTIRQNVELSQGITERIPLRLAPRVRRRLKDLPFSWLQEIAKRADLAPQTHHQHRNPSRSHSRSHTHRNALLSRSHSNYTSYESSSSSQSSSSTESSDSDSGPSPAFVEEGTEALAMQFYRIELAEQRRLMGVMEHHSKESGREVVDGKVIEQTHTNLAFPFSITAGVEKGAKNRYRHIWPFEHARVRLQNVVDADKKASKSEDDYVNASYIQPLGTNRRYIATQGPLEETFEDFWRLTWQQNVHVIIMLTKEIEGGMVKCGAYWVDTVNPPPERSFGPLRLKLVSKVGLPAAIDLMSDSDDARAALAGLQDNLSPGSGGGFGFGSALPPETRYQSDKTHKTHQSKKSLVTTIKRTFMLTHAGYPHLGARTIVHLQYLEWPDMNVPDDPRGVLELVKEVERAVVETNQSPSPVVTSPLGEEGEKTKGLAKVDAGSGIANHALGGCRPVLLHCSAGVGRTGGFITVDAVLDAVRRELQGKRARERAQVVKDGRAAGKAEGLTQEAEDVMDVDEPQQGIATVPLPVSRSISEVSNVDGDSNEARGLVLHVPAVIVPSSINQQTNTDSYTKDVQAQPDVAMDVQTPMQAGGADYNMFAFSGSRLEAGSTRKWAENVSNAYEPLESTNDRTVYATQLQLSQSPAGYSEHPSPSASVLSDRTTPDSLRPRHQSSPQLQPRLHHPLQTHLKDSWADYAGSTSSGSGSTFPSISDSEDSRRVRLRGGSLVRDSSPLATSVSSGGSEKEKNQPSGQQTELQGQGQRFRTFSAPHPQVTGKTRSLPLSLGLVKAAESSPLVESGEEIHHRQQQPPEPTIHAPHPISATGKVVFPSVDKFPHSNPDPQLRRNVPHIARSLQLSEHKFSPVHAVNNMSPPPTTVHYKEPRALHGKLTTPSPLSGYEEPILEVVQDMREQRMSLCQSLRQYVFVHQAIIEGALGIVDEEREKEREEVGTSTVNDRSAQDQQPKEVDALPMASDRVSSPFVHYKNALSSHNTQPHIPVTLPRLTRHSMPISSNSGGISDSGCSTTSSTGKRVASPTELLKEGKQGEVLLSKRPSTKRKLGTSGGVFKTTTIGEDPNAV